MWIVTTSTTAQTQKAYGPFGAHLLALRFAEWAGREIGPAEVVPLTMPVFELLAAVDRKRGEDALDEAVDQLIESGLLREIDVDVYASGPLNRTKKAAAPARATADHQPDEA